MKLHFREWHILKILQSRAYSLSSTGVYIYIRVAVLAVKVCKYNWDVICHNKRQRVRSVHGRQSCDQDTMEVNCWRCSFVWSSHWFWHTDLPSPQPGPWTTIRATIYVLRRNDISLRSRVVQLRWYMDVDINILTIEPYMK